MLCGSTVYHNIIWYSLFTDEKKTDVDEAELKNILAYTVIIKLFHMEEYLPKVITFSWNISLQLYLLPMPSTNLEHL
jgi:hypothetical protein